MDFNLQFATRTSRMKASELRELLKVMDQPGILSFAGGTPDPTLFPSAAFSAAFADALSAERNGQALQYSVSEGYLPLREWLAEHMTSIGVPCTAEDVFISSGSQQALDYLGKLFLSPGDTALVGAPTYLGALAAFNAYEPRYDVLRIADNRPVAGFGTAAEEAGGRVKFAYLSPDFANPSGVTLSATERAAVLGVAEELDCPIIEDAAYQALRYEGTPVPPILAMELAEKGDLQKCRTIYCGSFSKTLSPGLRVGWVVAAKPVIKKLVLMKQAGDLNSPVINQMAINSVARSMFDNHVATIRKAYAARRDAMLAALQENMPDGVEWTRPEGGMFVWLTLPPELNAADILPISLEQEKLAFVPGQGFFSDGSGHNSMRLSFSTNDEGVIFEGIARLGRLLRSML